jgi:8-oxo-dGTP pyrophosphatase MutT (NUDIX family)
VEPAEPAELVEPGRLTTLPLAPFTARALGLPAPPALPAGPAVPVAAGLAVPVAPQAADGGVPQVQRSGAYAVCVQDVVPAVGPPSPAVPSVLLARFVGNGEWTLPGGGIDHGEQPEDAVLREVYEETGLALSGPRLLDVLSVHFTGRAPGGRQEDFHAVRVVFTGTVPTDEPPHVTELDGTTDAAAWVPLARLGDRPVSELARTALRQVLAPSRPAGGP